MLDGKADLLDVVKFYLSNHRNGGPPKPTRFADAAALNHKFKIDSGKSESHCANIQSRLNRLGKALPADGYMNRPFSTVSGGN
jgi:hypothetical protein